MPDLSLQKQAQCLRIYIGESDRWRGKSLYSAVLETLRSQGMAGATVFRGVAGFGAHSRIRSMALEVLSLDLPVVIEVIDIPEKITGVLEVIYPMVREGLITLEDVQIVKYTHRFLNPLPADKLVAEVMTREVVVLSPDMTINKAWEQMLEKRIKAMPVVDKTGQVVGILTNEDLLKRAGLQQRLSIAVRLDTAELAQELRSLHLSTQKVSSVMTHPVITIRDTESLGTATARMVSAGLKRFPVINQQDKLVGMLSRLDVLRQVAQIQPVPPHADEPLPSHAIRTVRDIMTTDIPMVHQDEDLSAIIEKLAISGAHRLIVVDAQGKAAGLISDSDVVARVQPEKRRNILAALRRIGKPPLGKETAFDLMSPGPLIAAPDLPVVEAVRKMLVESRKWLVVVDENEKPLGLVDRQILLKAIAIFADRQVED